MSPSLFLFYCMEGERKTRFNRLYRYNSRGFLGIRGISAMANPQIRKLCGLMKRINENVSSAILKE